MSKKEDGYTKYSPRDLSPWRMWLMVVLLCLCVGCGKKPATDDEVTITFVGDITMHERQIKKYYTGNDDEFDVAKGLCYVRDYLVESDYAVGNLETTMAGRGQGPNKEVLGYSGYPYFNSPDSLAAALSDAGIDLVQTANNHCMDSGLNGLKRTLDVLDGAGIDHVGTYRSLEESNELYTVDIDGITFGYIAYTVEVNGNSYAKDEPYAINSLHSYDEEYVNELYANVETLDSSGVDCVVVMLHWGGEYEESSDEWQMELADGLFANGADIIIGSHPHDIQPVEIREYTDKNGKKKKGIVLYSLGDFLSDAVYDDDGVNKDLGLMARVVYSKETHSITDIFLIPTHIYETDNNVGVVPVLEANNNRDKYDFLSQKDWDRIEYAGSHVPEILDSMSNDNNMEYEISENEIHIIIK